MANKKQSAEELKRFLFNLTNTLVAKNCYIKTYIKNLYRVMDEKHNPEINITTRQFNILLSNEIIKQNADVWVVAVSTNPFKDFNSINLSIKKVQNETN